MEPNNNPAPSEAPKPEPTAPETSPIAAQPTTPPEPTPTPEPKPAKSSKPVMWCLAILAIIGIVAAIVFAYLYFTTPTTPPSPAPNNNQSSTPAESNQDSSASSNEETFASITLAEAKAMLADKYKFSTVEIPIYDGWYKFVNNFDQATKILFTIHQAEDKFEQTNSTSPSIRGEISFDDFNSEYSYYFGSEEPLEKKTYQLDSNQFISEIVYVPENDTFVVNFPDGIGGYTSARRINKVISVSDTKDGYKATIASATIDLGDDSDEYDSEAAETLSVYEFYFKKENNEYVLSSIKEL